MSTGSSPECSTTKHPGDNPHLKINQSTHQIVIENNSDDITISKCDQNLIAPEVSGIANSNATPIKAQVLPLVYIQNESSKIPFPGNLPSNNNFIFSPASTTSVTFGPKPTTTATSISINPNQNVIFAGRGRPLMLPKQPITIMPQGAKVTGTYVTMIKQVSKAPSDIHQVNLQPENLCTAKIAETITAPQNPMQLQASPVTQPQKFVLAGSISKIPTNSVLAPMPKIHSNRPPVTATTNSLQSAKFTVLPMQVPSKKNLTVPTTSQKVFNFQISDGKIYSNLSTPVTIMCDNSKKFESSTKDAFEDISEKMLISTEKIEDEGAEKNDISNKTYELSIAEEESLSNQSADGKLVVSSADSNSSGENTNNLNKPPIKFAHGVSILKKNFINSIFQDSKKPDLANSNTKPAIDGDITIVKPSNGVEERIIVTVPAPNIKKPERERSRRKSQFNFRKDFDEMDISFPDDDFDSSEVLIKDHVATTEVAKEEIKDEKPLDIDHVKSEAAGAEVSQEPVVPQVPVIDPTTILDIKPSEFDAVKCLTWEENIGSLPGSNLKFLLNEFGIIEYLPEDDYQKIIGKKQRKAKEKEDMEREVQCVECGCYGIRADFINTNFCSLDCQERAKLSPVKKQLESVEFSKAPKRKFAKHKSEGDIKGSNDASGEEENSNENSQDKFSYPWACKKKGFSWSKYLIHVNAKAAPVKLFKDPFPYTRNCFKTGMKLEGVDPQHPSYFCVLTVADTVGYRIRLHFDGYPNNYDFWTYADSLDIFPMGWCEKYGHILRAPPGYTEDNFNWVQYLRVTKSTAAPKHIFVNRTGQAICPNGFRIGMKLEAVDKKDSSLICVATVRDMMDNRILIHFDGWDDIYDYWVDPTSPYIHPVGWCDQYGHDLTPPSDYPTPENFTWEKYLKEIKAVAAPVRAFKQRATCGFKRDMRLECVDKRVPQLIRVATVDDVKEHQIRIRFDGWPDRYNYWVDDDSPDIHPAGWCQKTGHPIEPPLTPDDVYDFLECPTVGCRGQGHINGLKHSTHSSQKYCPYAEANIDLDKVVPDRLLSPDRSPEAKEPVSRQPKDYKSKPRLGRPPKWLQELNATKRDKSHDEPPEKRPRRKYTRRRIKKDEEEDEKSIDQSVEDKARSIIADSKILPVERESWKKHSDFLNDFIDMGENPLTWSSNDVMEFVTSIPGCDSHADCIRDHRIDGESFLQLRQLDIMHILKFKVGPAVKLYNSVLLLRQQYCDLKTKK